MSDAPTTTDAPTAPAEHPDESEETPRLAPIDSLLPGLRPDRRRWTTATDRSHWGVAFAGPQAGWAGGPDGRITKLGVD